LRTGGTTVVLITQRTQILGVADRILMLRDGCIERIGVRQNRSAASPDLDAAESAANTIPVLHQAR
jgi:ABC-type protease/lipase transport system fused ATPase/permease subunit